MVIKDLLTAITGLRIRSNAQAHPDVPLSDAIRRLVEGRRLVMASNRGPVEFVRPNGNGGDLEPRRGSGGVVTALSAITQSAPLTWIASPMGEGDRQMAAASPDGRIQSPFHENNLEFRFVPITQEAYDRYYNVSSNSLLWFLQHYMWDIARTPTINAAMYDAWENGYTVVNRTYADVIVQEIAGQQDRPVVLFQDYHLYLAPGYVREQVPEAVLQHFIHIPWPAPRYWLLLPEMMRMAIVRSLCANDIVGFQTHGDVLNFLYTCEAFLENAVIDHHNRTIRWHGRTIYVRAYPVSIDLAAIRETAASEEARCYLEKLLPLQGEHTIVRVDRLEPTKNIVRGFLAFDGLLMRYPELAGKVKFWSFLVPSRTDLKQYQQYSEEVFAIIEKINQQHGSDAWRPIELFYENNYTQAIVAMSCADVLLVNGVIDGMNLVAKEGPTVNTRDAVLVISEGVGACEQLGPYALAVAPTDVEGTIRALHAALTMPAEERKTRAQQLRDVIAQQDSSFWVGSQVRDILALL